MADIDHYCRVYDNFLEDSDCDEYIAKFEETITFDAERHRELSVCYREDGSMICGQCDCMRTNPMEYPRFHDLNLKLIDKWLESIERYKEDTGIDQFKYQWPKQYGLEELRIKKFRVDSNKGHGLNLHTDVYSYAHAKRFLCMMVYLNDDFTDGETFTGQTSQTTAKIKDLLGTKHYIVKEDYIVGDQSSDYKAQNEYLNTLDDTIFDFSESNPFSEGGL